MDRRPAAGTCRCYPDFAVAPCGAIYTQHVDTADGVAPAATIARNTGASTRKPQRAKAFTGEDVESLITWTFSSALSSVPGALAGAQSWIGTCFSAHASTTAATMS